MHASGLDTPQNSSKPMALSLLFMAVESFHRVPVEHERNGWTGCDEIGLTRRESGGQSRGKVIIRGRGGKRRQRRK